MGNTGDNGKKRDTLIGAERRRKICAVVDEQGYANVSSLAHMLGVAPTTIRTDLDRLEQEGRLLRSHGGAVAKDSSSPRLPYSETKDTHLPQKEWIGQAATGYLPSFGVMFISPGTTTFELARRIPDGLPIQVVTQCARIAVQLSGRIDVHLLGGKMRRDSFGTNCQFDPALDLLHWDVAFLGMPSVDPDKGMCTVDLEGAMIDKRVIEHTRKLIVLCDSSKFGRASYVTVGPVSLIDVLITDTGVNPETVEQITAQGVEVVVVGPGGGRTA